MVRLHFQKRPWDLFLTLGYTASVVGLLFFLNVGTLLAILLILFVPGYLVIAALFPAAGEIGWIERLVLSVVLSLAVVPLLGLLLSLVPWGIRFTPTISAGAIFAVGVGCTAYWRRIRLPEGRRLSGALNLAPTGWKEFSPLERVLSVGLVISVIVAVGTLVFVATSPRPGETFTEFYILGSDGNATGYPKRLNVSETSSVILGITNHESAMTTYGVRVDLVGMQILYNATSGANETVELNRTLWSSINVTLMDGENWISHYSFSISAKGLWKVQFVLFTEGSSLSAYRSLHLFIAVT